jgi:hypothetical protein
VSGRAPRSVHLRPFQSGPVVQPPLAQPPPLGSYRPSGPGRPPDAAVIGIILVIVLAVFGIVAFASVGGPTSMMFSSGAFLCVPIVFAIIFLVIAFAQGASRRTIPPPPPIQQPMVPAGQQGPVALSCPNCGGPPTNVDRFGIATCSYCGTRFLVR